MPNKQSSQQPEQSRSHLKAGTAAGSASPSSAGWAHLRQQLQDADNMDEDSAGSEISSPTQTRPRQPPVAPIASSNAADASMLLRSPPAVSRLRREEMRMFGSDPLAEELVLVRCNACQKPLLPSSFAEHAERCQGLHHGRGTGDASSSAGTARKRQPDHAAMNLHSANNGVPMPAADPRANTLADLDASLIDPVPAHLRHIQLHRKKPGMVDFDMQCGVLTVSGKPCTRPITCKVHSMYAKSTVTGRSNDLETLLRRYQLKVERKYLGFSCYEDWDRSERQQQQHQPLDVEENILDGDKDVEALLDAIHRRRPPPVAVPSYTCIKRRTNSLRMRDLFYAVLNNQRIKVFGNPLSMMQLNRGQVLSALQTAPIPMSPVPMTAASPLSNITHQPPLQLPSNEGDSGNAGDTGTGAGTSTTNTTSSGKPKKPRKKSVTAGSSAPRKKKASVSKSTSSGAAVSLLDADGSAEGSPIAPTVPASSSSSKKSKKASSNPAAPTAITIPTAAGPSSTMTIDPRDFQLQ